MRTNNASILPVLVMQPADYAVTARIMEHVAQTLGLDPVQVRERNFLRSLPSNQVRLLPCI